MRDIDAAFDHFPIIMFDRMEPFLPNKVGFSVFRRPSDSRVDYSRKLGGAAAISFDLPSLEFVIEYGIWWDWDIEHLYELEAVWVYIDRDGEYLRVEASSHGGFVDMKVGGRIPLRDGRPVLFSQPGKHAFAASPDAFSPQNCMAQCTRNSGSMGVLASPLFEGRIRKTKELDSLVKEYLRKRAFAPSFSFTKEWRMPRGAFEPWDQMAGWIPPRVEEILSRLARGQMA